MLGLSSYLDNLFSIPHGLFYIILGVTILMNIISFLAFYFDSKNPIGSTTKASVSALSFYTLLLGGLGALIAVLSLNYQNRRKRYIILSIISIIFNSILLGLIF